MTKAGNNKLLVLLLLTLSAVLLTIIQPPVNLSLLAFVALVPFILACIYAERLWSLLLASYVIALLYWLFNLYWLIPVTTAGLVAGCLYLAALWPLAAVAIRFCYSKKIPLVIAVPVIFVGAERLQGFFLGGFFWRFLAHSQYANLSIIQIADIFGAAGVSFIVAVVNGLFAEIIIATREKKIFSKILYLETAVVFGLVLAVVFYGRWRLGQTEAVIEQGPLVGSVQSNIPQSVKDTALESKEVAIETFDKIAADSNSASDAGALLCVWPETIVPAVLDDRLLRIVESNSISKYFDSRLCAIAKGRSYLLVGARGMKPLVLPDYKIEAAESYNSAFLYMSSGYQSIEQYNKIHLVPFGEFVPFRKSFPPLYRLLMKLTPYDFDYSLDAGSEYTIFRINSKSGGEQKVYRFGVMICYEDTVPDIARKFVLKSDGTKQADWLLNISNDGWFVQFSNGQAKPSTELAQHASICVFRAVENRVPIVRSVNTGISCLIDSSGKIRDGFVAGSLPRRALERRGMSGWFVDKLSIDKRITIFSRYGQWLDNFSAILFAAAIFLAAIMGLHSRALSGKRGTK